MKNHRLIHAMSIFGILLIVLYGIHAFAENRIKEGMNLPLIMLEGSDCMEKGDYLGVENDERYMEVTRISAKLMIIEFFTVQCPVCQKQASVANKIFNILKRDPDLKKDVKIFSIAIGNRQNEIDAYKKQHNVKYPVFVDPYKKMTSQHGIDQVPYTMIVNKDLEVLSTHIGIIENLKAFMKKLSKFHEKG